MRVPIRLCTILESVLFIGVPALDVVTISSSSPFTTSHAHPEPNCAAAALDNCSFIEPKEPNDSSIDSRSNPSGSFLGLWARPSKKNM